MWVLKLLIVVLYVIIAKFIVRLFYDFACWTRNEDELCMGELSGASLIGACFAALFGAFIKPDLILIMVVAGVIACACWAVVLWFKAKPNRIHKALYLSVRMLGIAGVLATAMLPLCRLAA